jgi:hypothetical protein
MGDVGNWAERLKEESLWIADEETFPDALGSWHGVGGRGPCPGFDRQGAPVIRVTHARWGMHCRRCQRHVACRGLLRIGPLASVEGARSELGRGHARLARLVRQPTFRRSTSSNRGLHAAPRSRSRTAARERAPASRAALSAGGQPPSKWPAAVAPAPRARRRHPRSGERSGRGSTVHRERPSRRRARPSGAPGHDRGETTRALPRPLRHALEPARAVR